MTTVKQASEALIEWASDTVQSYKSGGFAEETA